MDDNIRQRLETSLRDALKARDVAAAAALRSVMSAIQNAEAVEAPDRVQPRFGIGAGDVARRELSPDEVVAILRAEIADRESAATEYQRLRRSDDAARLRAEATVLQSHLDHA